MQLAWLVIGGAINVSFLEKQDLQTEWGLFEFFATVSETGHLDVSRDSSVIQQVTFVRRV